MQTKKAIIIGSGVAGMAIATRLCVQGFEVHVYEANNYPGGKLSVFEKDGYRFDAGPSLFTQPQNIEELFAYANEPIADYFSYQPVEVACNYFFENKKSITAHTDKGKFAEELAVKLGEEKSSVINYLSAAEKLYHDVGCIFLNYSLHKKETWLNKRILQAIKSVRLSYLFGTLHAHNKKSFKSEEAVQIFNRFATYNGSNPYRAPGMLSLIPHLEQNEGTFYPAGGMISITNALYNLAVKKGATFHFGKKADRIIYEGGKIKGITVNDTFTAADILVSNADIYFTYKNLLQQPIKATKLLKQERSSSALIFYWGINKSFSALGLHNILFSANYEEEFDHLFNKKTLADDSTIYINITSKMEPTHAPSGKENWFVMINTPANYGQDWSAIVAHAKSRAIQKINRMLDTDIEAHIETEEVLTPTGIEEKTRSFMGSLYGTSSNSMFAAFFRSPNFSDKIKGLYFCGGTVHPGGGIPLCMKSASITAELIRKQHQ